MHSFIPTCLASALALIAIPQTSAAEEPPAGALEKITQALPEKAFAKPQHERTILIFAKTNGFHHASIPTGKLALQEMGKKTGAYQVVISDDLANFETDALKKFDAICFLSTTGNAFSPDKNEQKTLTDAQKQTAAERDARLKTNVMAFIKSGHGFIGIHSATDSFYEWPEYGKMINGYFNGHPWHANKQVSIKVEPGQEKHPLAAMFHGENIEFPEEIYQFKEPYDSKAVHMLLRLDVTKTDMTSKDIKRTDGDFGISWARHWGKGRVFYSSLGHNHEIYENPKVLLHFLAGMQWALGDYEVVVKDPVAGTTGAIAE